MRFFVLMIYCLLSSPVLALEEQEVYSTEIYSLDKIVDEIPNYTKTPEGGVDWAVFSKTKATPYKITQDDGEVWEGVKPEFTSAVQNLNGQKIKMTGYMFPLDQTEEQKQFLLGPFPLSCPYHSHTPINLTIESYADVPIKFSYEPITVEGVLELVPEDLEYNTFYRLKGVSLLKSN